MSSGIFSTPNRQIMLYGMEDEYYHANFFQELSLGYLFMYLNQLEINNYFNSKIVAGSRWFNSIRQSLANYVSDVLQI